MTSRRLFAALAATIAAACACAAAGPAGAGAAETLPVEYDGATGYAHASPTAAPPGANNWSCKTTRAHPRPVVLVHGTFADMADSWQALSPLFVDNGYCVFALNYGSSNGSGELGVDATGPIATSAEELGAFVQKVLSATGAGQVDMVGHSQGGMMPRYYLRFLGGAPKVHTLVGLAPSNHGTTVNGLFTLGKMLPGANSFLGLCQACEEQEAGSPFLTKLNAGGETVGKVRYTVIESNKDEVVTPYTSAFMSGKRVTNILLQQQCALDQGEHLSMPYDHIADADVLSALDAKHPVAGACSPVLPVIGG
ncbi:MAG TPA: alpha/beta fold hydrolase [Solirubrobacteraceae bacterium]|jgi:triacylglycerol esterase/lipase EstA (alpha/beta hydrolase family)|nr:alpha/beta fold hydrolase [Solirubrobacteraceae bacterium]